jgi:hypothetical protein
MNTKPEATGGREQEIAAWCDTSEEILRDCPEYQVALVQPLGHIRYLLAELTRVREDRDTQTEVLGQTINELVAAESELERLKQALATIQEQARFVYIDSTYYEYHLGEDMKPLPVYADEESCKAAHKCIDNAVDEFPCKALRVAVIDAELVGETVVGSALAPQPQAAPPTIEERLARGERGIAKIPDSPETRHARLKSEAAQEQK